MVEAEGVRNRSQSQSDAAAVVRRIFAAKRSPFPFDHGHIDRDIAEVRFLMSGMVEGMYLLRHKEGGSLALSYVHRGDVCHRAAIRISGGFQVDGEAIFARNANEVMAYWRMILGALLLKPLYYSTSVDDS